MNEVITNITKRWEEGIPHHPKSIEIFKIIKDNDWKYGGDYFCWKSGGDGDNGEHLMYLLDIHFEIEDQKMTIPGLISENQKVLNEKYDNNPYLDICEQCEENAWDGYICHNYGLKII